MEMWYSLLHTMEALLCKSDLLFPGACCLSATKDIMEEVLWLFQPSDYNLFLFICGCSNESPEGDLEWVQYDSESRLKGAGVQVRIFPILLVKPIG